MSKTAKKKSIEKTPVMPTPSKQAIKGNKKLISRSKIRKSMATT
jgi:hypothetical protein